MDKTKVIILSIIGGAVLLLVLFVIGFLSQEKEEPRYQVEATLNFWGVEDSALAYEEIIGNFENIYPNVKVEYRGFEDVDSYERTLLNALAAGTGPDIFMVRNNDLFKKYDKITPIPETYYTLLELRNDSPEVVEKDFVLADGVIYALPLSIDTLSLIYNKDIFNEEAVVFPPKTWEDFRDLVPQLVRYDENGRVKRAAAAMGGARNIKNAKDILSLLMMQFGASMVSDDYKTATFSVREGESALEFYTQFANPISEYYTWDDYMSDSIGAFAKEEAAMLIDYSSAVHEIKSRAPFLNIGVAPVPQPKNAEKQMSYASYWGYTVSSQSKYPGVAWDFILYMTLDPKNAESYLKSTKRPPALSVLIDKYKNNPDFSVFARQALIAKSWTEPDPELVNKIFSNMIEAVTREGVPPSRAIKDAENEVTRLMQTGF